MASFEPVCRGVHGPASPSSGAPRSPSSSSRYLADGPFEGGGGGASRARGERYALVGGGTSVANETSSCLSEGEMSPGWRLSSVSAAVRSSRMGVVLLACW